MNHVMFMRFAVYQKNTWKHWIENESLGRPSRRLWPSHCQRNTSARGSRLFYFLYKINAHKSYRPIVNVNAAGNTVFEPKQSCVLFSCVFERSTSRLKYNVNCVCHQLSRPVWRADSKTFSKEVKNNQRIYCACSL